MPTGALVIAISLAGFLATTALGAVRSSAPKHLQMHASGSVKPGVLPAKVEVPAALHIGTGVRNFEGSRPPAIWKLRLEWDRGVELDSSEVPVCRAQGIPNSPPPWPRCQKAIVGHATAVVTFAYPENSPIDEHIEFAIYNGGMRNGITKLWLHGHINVAGLGAIVLPAKVKKIDAGGYGWRADIVIPALGEGYGSLISFNLTIRKRVLSARCPRKALLSRVAAWFQDGSYRQLSSPIECLADRN